MKPCRTISIELELELDYVGLTDEEIKDRCYKDQESIVAAIHAGTSPVLPDCLMAFRFKDRAGGTFFVRPNTEPHHE